jgi:hypothetical protein
MAVLCQERENQLMKTNQYGSDSEPLSMLYSANDTVDRTDQKPELDRTGHTRVFGVGDSPSGADAAAIANRRSFPLRTLMVCFTIWLIATQAMIFDQIKFAERAHLIEEATRPPGGPQVVVPNEPASNLPTGGKVQRL